VKPVVAETLPLSGKVVIEASAGTGKTYTITSIYLRLVIERGLSPRQILVVTFTRAATAELRDRIRLRLSGALDELEQRIAGSAPEVGDPLLATLLAGREQALDAVARGLLSALDELDDAPILTIHGFCQRVLGEHALDSGAEIGAELVADTSSLIDEIVDDFTVRELADTSEARAALLYREHAGLSDLARLTAAARELRVLPESAADAEIDLRAFRERQAECRALFHAQRAEIEALLRSVAKIERYVDSWLPRVEAALDAPYPPLFDDKNSALDAVTHSGFDERLPKARKGRESHAFFHAMEALRAEQEAVMARASDARVAFRRSFVEHARGELARRTRQRAKATFDALLATVHDALGAPTGPSLVRTLQQKHKVALLDEFQDTDPLQYAIFDRLYGAAPHGLFMIGDPKQAIYAFRGADVLAYMRAREAAGDQVFTLAVNYRSDPSLLAALNLAYQRTAQPFVRDDIAYVEVSAPEGRADRLLLGASDPRRALDLVFAEEHGSTALYEALASDVVASLASDTLRTETEVGRRKLLPSDVAVLCRTNMEARQMADALEARGVPVQLPATESVFETDDARFVERTLAALVHPSDERLTRAFLATPYGGSDAADLALLEREDARLASHRERLGQSSELLYGPGLLPAFSVLFRAYGSHARLVTRPDGARMVQNLAHLTELLSDAATRMALGPASLLRLLRRAIVRPDARELFGIEAHFVRPLEEADAVTLVTVHKSKGLEYPLVYVPFLSSARDSSRGHVTFHDPAAGDTLTLALDDDERERGASIAAAEELAEATRLLYVALTRARHRVSLVVTPARGLTRSPLTRLLLASPAEAPADPKGALAAMRSHAESLRTQLTAAVSVRALPLASDARYRPEAHARPKLQYGRTTRVFEVDERVASFSALASGGKSPEADNARDHDAAGTAEPPGPARDRADLTLAAFPRGARAGQLIHEAIEQLDFDAAPEALRASLAPFEATGRLTPHDAALLAQGLGEVFESPLDASGLRLCDIPRARRVDELEFLLPVPGQFEPADLAAVFSGPAAPSFAPDYHTQLRELDFARFGGFLRGFIDLVFERDGRYFLADYKSNALGSHVHDYAPERLVEPMTSHHYVLQYHLYALALHRQLALRVRGYDYAQHFGGVYYLFLRGMAPRHPAHNGVFFARPERALLDALDALLKEGA
jgi:exodeoxyribonuclease V beta subunit